MNKEQNHVGFILEDENFDSGRLGRNESVMCQGNGYLGLRNSLEEEYIEQQRGLFIAGTFNRASGEAPELPNAADILGIDLELDGERFALNEMEVLSCVRRLNMRTGLAERSVDVKLKSGKGLRLVFRRFVSMENKHLICQRIEIVSSDDVCLKLRSGINGRMVNSGAHHFSEGEKRFYDSKIMQAVFTTTQSEIGFVYHTVINLPSGNSPRIYIDRRRIGGIYSANIPKSTPFIIEKRSTIHTTRDLEHIGLSLEELKTKALLEMRSLSRREFGELLDESITVYDKLWEKCDIKITGNSFDQLAARFAVYQLTIMAPAHDSRMSIGARGLSCEHYKGHTFWDTEVFCLPFFIYSQPETARMMLEYRWHSLEGAREKAAGGNYDGAQYPWESAWINDGEVTPEWGPADIMTGKPMKVLGGFIQHHITADVVWAIRQYFELTNDYSFMNEAGYQIIFETAKFWASRLDFNSEKDRYEINDVMGPDEYKTHVNNNAYTNYMAHYNMELALRCKTELSSGVFERLQAAPDIESICSDIEKKLRKFYLPQANADGVIPQDDTYLEKKEIDLTPFKNQKTVDEIFGSYNLDQLREIQVTKQADVLLALCLLADRFNSADAKKNYQYYEPRTLHDSSLSLATHCLTAVKIGDLCLAYELLQKVQNIDLGPEAKPDGVHAATLGGLWQCVVLGFGGVSHSNGEIHINPALPENWDELEFTLSSGGSVFGVRITHGEVVLTPKEICSLVTVYVKGEKYILEKETGGIYAGVVSVTNAKKA